MKNPTPDSEQLAPGGGSGPSSSEHEALRHLAASLADDGSGQSGRVASVLTRVAEFLQLNPGVTRTNGMPLDFLLDVIVSVQAELGHATLSIGDILKLEPGSVVELDREVSQPVDLVVCGVLFARGEVVVVDDRFALRIKELVPRGTRREGR